MPTPAMSDRDVLWLALAMLGGAEVRRLVGMLVGLSFDPLVRFPVSIGAGLAIGLAIHSGSEVRWVRRPTRWLPWSDGETPTA